MRITHHIGPEFSSASQRSAFLRAGVDLEAIRLQDKDPSTLVVVFDILEDDFRWPAVEDVLRTYPDVLHVRWTTFEENELDTVPYVAMTTKFVRGYPQPERGMAFRSATFDRSEACTVCGTGYFQNAPFRMKNEVSWGRNSICQMFWVEDEFFVTPEAWQTVFEPHGVASREVLKRGGDKLTGVVQLDVPQLIEHEMPNDLPFEDCMICGRRRYRFVVRGPSPPPAIETDLAMFKSSQYFGTGHAAWRQVTMSNALYRDIMKRKLLGAEFKVCSRDHLFQGYLFE